MSLFGKIKGTLSLLKDIDIEATKPRWAGVMA